jgi:hypothetical protein
MQTTKEKQLFEHRKETDKQQQHTKLSIENHKDHRFTPYSISCAKKYSNIWTGKMSGF